MSWETSPNLSEVVSLTTADGLTLYFSGDTIRLLAYGGFGAPGQDFLTRRGFKQHGETEIDFLLQPRTIQVLLWRAQACDRDTYWANRMELHEYLRPNRGGQMTFTLQRPDGTRRAIKVRANPGLTLQPQPPQQNYWGVQEAVEFVCHDPTFFDPVSDDTQVSSSVDTDLVFPITFPIKFGVSGTQFNHNIVYTGTWSAYPQFRLEGPYSSAAIHHIISGTVVASIYMGVPLAAGDVRIIDLTPGEQSIKNAAGESKNKDLGPGSNLVNFFISPTPEAPGGVQTIQAIFNAGSAASKFRVTYNKRYYAL